MSLARLIDCTVLVSLLVIVGLFVRAIVEIVRMLAGA